MVRLKTSLQPINDPKIRATTFQRRKEGIIKKASELSTLCDVDVSMIIFDGRHQTPEIFPPNPDKFATLINLHKEFRTTYPKKIKSHQFNKLEKAKRGNLRPKYPTWHEFLNGFSERSLREFSSVLENKTHQVKTQIESLKKTPKFENLENPPNPIIVLDDDGEDVVENPSPTTSMITSNNMDDCKTFGLFTGDHQNSDSMMTEEDFNNLLGIDTEAGDKSSLESIMLSEKVDNKYWYDDANFGFQIDDQFPEFEFCFSPETMQQLLQPESSSCYMEMNEFATPSLPSSHVMDYITISDYGY